jgi:transcription-repair coupling factor (superfamily II helicase)
VGRSNHQAYAFLLYQAHKALTEDAKARLEAIREFTHLGSGLQIAMRDLEIRGAGNLLGAAQSGFIGAVGFETYAQLLAEAIAARQGRQAAVDAREAVIDVKLDAFVPNDYIPQVSQKIAVYQELAAARTLDGVDDIVASVRDRFGPLPEPLENLAEITRLRVLALQAGVTRVVINEQRLTLGVGLGFHLDPAAIPKLQSITKNRFRFGEGKVTIDVPARRATDQLPTLRALLQALTT